MPSLTSDSMLPSHMTAYNYTPLLVDEEQEFLAGSSNDNENGGILYHVELHVVLMDSHVHLKLCGVC